MKVDPVDLINAAEVAEVLGLSHRESVGIYRRRYPDFPQPVIRKGTCVLWLRADIRAKARAKPRL